MAVTFVQRYILLSIYIALDLLGIAILLIVVDKLPEDVSMDKMQNKLKLYCMQPFVELFRLLFSRNMLLLGPLSLYNGMELSFAYSSFTQVSCNQICILSILLYSYRTSYLSVWASAK